MYIQLSHVNRISEWTSFELYTWITKNHEKFNLNQEDLDSIEESPLSGKQLLHKDDEQLSQEWAISIHAARKIVKKANALERKAEKRKSEPIMGVSDDDDEESGSPVTPLKHIPLANGHSNHKASTGPSLKNIPEEQKMIDQSIPYSLAGHKRSMSSYSWGARQNIAIPSMDGNIEYFQSLQQTKLTLTIKNDTFMGRLAHPKWWMDGHFSHIPNKIGSKDSISIDITGDIDTPLVGIMSFTLTLDPRYASKYQSMGTGSAAAHHTFSPYIKGRQNIFSV